LSPLNKKAILIVIYPYKFLEFVWNLLELDEFKCFIDVQVWDISSITSPNFSEGVVVGRSLRSEVITCVSMYDYISRLFALRRQTAYTNICILNGISGSYPAEFLCNLFLIFFLRTKNVKVFDLYNGGVPIVYSKDKENENDYAAQQNSSLFAKFTRFISRTTTVTEAWRTIRASFLIRLLKLMPTALTHRLVAGEQWLSLAMGAKKNNISIIRGHSYDYSNYLLAEKVSSSKQHIGPKTAVFLSSANPYFGSDEILSGGDQQFTSEVWYPALVRFFDLLESHTGVTIEVAGHYKSAFPAIAPCFGNRSVHYGRTLEMVRQSEYVITITSTAISYAVVFKKPVIFIYSNQLKDSRNPMEDIRGMAAMLGTKPVNIDQPDIEISHLLTVNEEKYLDYENACLTSARSPKPNFQIILEEIMSIRGDNNV
jgi:hypothetical protein